MWALFAFVFAVGVHAVEFPCYVECSCGQRYWADNARTAASATCRCRKTHISDSMLTLAAVPMTLATTMFIILSHRRAASQHRALIKELVARGIKRCNIAVRYGFSFPDTHGDSPMLPNQICHFSVRFRWIRTAAEAIRDAKGMLRHIVYLENSAKCCFDSFHCIGDMVNKASAKYTLLWLGFLKMFEPNEHMNHHANPVIMGSRCIVFQHTGLAEMRKAVCQSLYRHFDLLLCKHVPLSKLFVPRVSLFGSRKHVSVPIAGPKGKPRVREAMPPGVKKIFK